MFKETIKIGIIFVFATVISVGTQIAIASWQEPTGNPVDNNVPAPINVGDSSQVKSGQFGVANSVRDGISISVAQQFPTVFSFFADGISAFNSIVAKDISVDTLRVNKGVDGTLLDAKEGKVLMSADDQGNVKWVDLNNVSNTSSNTSILGGHFTVRGGSGLAEPRPCKTVNPLTNACSCSEGYEPIVKSSQQCHPGGGCTGGGGTRTTLFQCYNSNVLSEDYIECRDTVDRYDERTDGYYLTQCDLYDEDSNGDYEFLQ